MTIAKLFSFLCPFVACTAVSSSLEKVDIAKSGIGAYVNICSIDNAPICFESIEIDDKNKVFLSVFSDFDSIEEYQGDDTSQKVDGAIVVMKYFLAIFNTRYAKKLNASSEEFKVNFYGGNSDEVVILMTSNINDWNYVSYALIDDNDNLDLMISQKEVDVEKYYIDEVYVNKSKKEKLKKELIK